MFVYLIQSVGCVWQMFNAISSLHTGNNDAIAKFIKSDVVPIAKFVMHSHVFPLHIAENLHTQRTSVIQFHFFFDEFHFFHQNLFNQKSHFDMVFIYKFI